MAADTLPQAGFFDKHRDKIEYGAPSGCWLWAAATSGNGYGYVNVRGKMNYAHREAYETVHGEGSAAGLVIRHSCDTPACVNPSHLEGGTHADNTRDMMERGRHVPPCVRGEINGSAKLTEANVATIRTEYVRGSSTHGQPAMARRFGVAHTLIGKIIRREIWTHLP